MRTRQNFTLLTGLGLSAALGACATAAEQGGEPLRPPPEAESCTSAPGQAFIGKRASAATGSDILAATGADVLRWAPPDSALTMDYRADRVTVHYDRQMVITRVSCG